MLTAFLDESGTHNQGVCVSVAGFYGDEDQWKTFRDLWKPHSEGFHAFKSSSRFPVLCEAIKASRIDGILVTLWKANYKVLATSHMKSFMGNPYAVCAFLCAMHICDESKNTPVSFVYEQGQPNFEFVKRVLDSMTELGGYHITSVASAKKVDFIELHPADLVSHCASSYDKLPLQYLFNAGLLKHGHVTEKTLRDVGPQVTPLVKQWKWEKLKAKRHENKASASNPT